MAQQGCGQPSYKVTGGIITRHKIPLMGSREKNEAEFK